MLKQSLLIYQSNFVYNIEIFSIIVAKVYYYVIKKIYTIFF